MGARREDGFADLHLFVFYSEGLRRLLGFTDPLYWYIVQEMDNPAAFDLHLEIEYTLGTAAGGLKADRDQHATEARCLLVASVHKSLIAAVRVDSTGVGATMPSYGSVGGVLLPGGWTNPMSSQRRHLNIVSRVLWRHLLLVSIPGLGLHIPSRCKESEVCRESGSQRLFGVSFDRQRTGTISRQGSQ